MGKHEDAYRFAANYKGLPFLVVGGISSAVKFAPKTNFLLFFDLINLIRYFLKRSKKKLPSYILRLPKGLIKKIKREEYLSKEEVEIIAKLFFQESEI